MSYLALKLMIQSTGNMILKLIFENCVNEIFHGIFGLLKSFCFICSPILMMKQTDEYMGIRDSHWL